MTSATLSVVIPNYNHAQHLPKALTSIVEQSYQPLEILVLDDGSSDESVSVALEFASRHPTIQVLRNERNMGVLPSFNRLLALARGDYILAAAADDFILPGLLEKSMGLLERHPAAGLCSAMSNVLEERTGRIVNVIPVEPIAAHDGYVEPAAALHWLRRHESWIVGNTTVYRRDALIQAGGFIPELRAFCDGFIQMVLTLQHGACFVPEPLATWRLSPGGYSATSLSSLQGSLDMWAAAARLMRTTYAHLFPADFVTAWERQRACHARLSALNRLRQVERDVIRALWPDTSMADRLAVRVLELVQWLQFGGVMSYLMLRSRAAAWPVLKRAIRVWVDRVRLARRAGNEPAPGSV